jgi:hypothetical protein
MASRPYTGNKDAAGVTGAKPGTQSFQNLMCFLFGMKNLGIYANRTVRGSGSATPPLSVHATGRACDLGGTPKQCKEATEFLFAWRDRLGIEEIHDYKGHYMQTKGFGAGYRCDRDAWKVYDKNMIGPGGNWVHYEISPEMANDPAKVEKVFTEILNEITKALEGLK